jgi:hypothetical protein
MTAVTLRRYTNLAAAIHSLRNKTITLLDPASWDDRNDAYFMSQYKKRKPAQTLLALCFAESSETYHRWRVFSHGSDGVCLEFDKDRLLSSLLRHDGLQANSVIYKQIEEVRTARPSVDELPFLKRYLYRDEKEFRLIYVDQMTAIESKEFDIPIECIRRVSLSPWMPPALSDSVTATLRDIKGCAEVEISGSQLVDYEKWKRPVLSGANLSS